MNYTSIEQSKKLLELGLSPESADMVWNVFVDDSVRLLPKDDWDVCTNAKIIPCWSVGALLELIPFECNLHKFTTEEGTGYRLESFYLNHTKFHQYPIDACVEMMEWVIENNH